MTNRKKAKTKLQRKAKTTPIFTSKIKWANQIWDNFYNNPKQKMHLNPVK